MQAPVQRLSGFTAGSPTNGQSYPNGNQSILNRPPTNGGPLPPNFGALALHSLLAQRAPDLARAYLERTLSTQQLELVKRFAAQFAPQLKEEARRAQYNHMSNLSQQSNQNLPQMQRPPSTSSQQTSPTHLHPATSQLAARVTTPQMPLSNAQSPASASSIRTMPPTSLNLGTPPPPVAGVKRKSPPPGGQLQSSHLPPGAPQSAAEPQPPSQQQTARPQFARASSESRDVPFTSTEPGPQPWPNAAGPRPTLTGGLSTGVSLILATPTYLAFPQVDAETLEAALLPIQTANAAAEAARKESTGGMSGSGTKKTFKEIVGSIDPRIRVESEVEGFMLELADEFIDSAIHFACLIAKHRGSDTLDVRDLQLHLESNLNLRIPGFTSDETRVSISHSSALGDVLLGAIAGGNGPGAGMKKTAAPKAKGGKGKAAAAAASAAASAAAAVTAADKEGMGRGLRTVRMAAVRATKK